MKPRMLSAPERLEDRSMMDGDPISSEFFPVAHGAAEKRADMWNVVRDATTATQVHHFDVDQAGLQRHLWSGVYYGWEGLAEFDLTLPEGAIVEAATLYLTVTEKVDTMNRKPSLVVHLATQEEAGTISTSEFANAIGEQIGSIAFDEVTPGQEIGLTLDPTRIPTNGNALFTLRTSDLIAGQEPSSNHNSRSVFYFNGMRLDVRYRVSEAAPEPEPEPEQAPATPTRIIDIPALQNIGEHTHVQFDPDLGAEVWSGSERDGLTSAGGVLRSVGANTGARGGVDNPLATDHIIMRFDSPLTKPVIVQLWTDASVNLMGIKAYGNGVGKQFPLSADGKLRIDASPESPVADFSLVNSGMGKYGVDYFEIEDEEELAATPTEPGNVPDAVRELIAEAIALSMNGPEWRVPEAGELVRSMLAHGLHLNLRNAEAPAVGIRATVTANGAAVTAHVYRGTDLLGSVSVPTDGTFEYAYDEGFTDVLFTAGNGPALSATNVEISTDDSLHHIEAEPIGPLSSAQYALAAFPDIPQPTDWSRAQNLLNLDSSRRGTSSQSGYDSYTIVHRDPTKYTLVRLQLAQGNGKFVSTHAVKLIGLDNRNREITQLQDFPSGHVQVIDDTTLVIAPGGPSRIVVRRSVWGYAHFETLTQGGPSIEAVMPPMAMTNHTLNLTLIKMYEQHKTEGVLTPLTEVQEGPSPVFASPGHIANLQYHIYNRAMTGGTVTANVYVGWYAGEPTRGTLQDTFQLSMTGGQTQRISVNVIAPHKPADATSDRPIISVVLTLPDGTVVENQKLGKEPKSREKRVYTRNEDGTTTMHIESEQYTAREQARIHELTDRALSALLNSDDNRLVAVRDTLGVDHVIELIAKNTAAALALADQMAEENATDEAMATMEELLDAELETMIDGIGGDPDETSIWDPDALAQHQQLHPYNPSKNNLLVRLSSGEIQLLQKTALGKFFLGIAQRAVEATNDEELMQVANVIHNATGIATKKANIFLNAATSAERRVDMLKQMFSPSNPAHGDELLRSIFHEQPIVNGEITKTSISLTEEHAVRIRFNFATLDQDFHHGNVYLVSPNGQQLSDQPLLNANITDQFFVDIPMINIARVARETFGLGGLDLLSDTRFRFKIALWDEFNSPAGLQGENVTDAIDLPQVISMNRPDYVEIGSYSTLPNTPELQRRRELENHVLSTIKQNFPLDRSLTWLNTLGSDFHLGQNSAAMDLNINTGGDNDEGLPVKVVADGTIDSIGLNYGSIRVRHTAEINGEVRYWFTTYLHMRLVANGTTPDGQILYETHDKDGRVIATLHEGQSLEAQDVIGGIGGRGIKDKVINDYAFKTHLHMEAEDDAGNMIHFGKLLTDMGIQTYAEDSESVPADMIIGGRRILSWNDSIDEWVNETYNVIFDQDASSTGHNNVWVAMTDNPNERKRVIWKLMQYSNEPLPKFRWVAADNDNEEWMKDTDGQWRFQIHA